MRPRFSILFALAILFGTLLPQSPSFASPTAQPARHLTVLAGFGQDTLTINAFFPTKITIRAGDTITWKQNGDSGHTVSFLGAFPGPASSNPLPEPGALIPAMNFPFPGRAGTNYQNPVRTFPYPGQEAFGSTYRPGEFVSSGRLANVPSHLLIPDVFEFSLTFDTPGTYAYLCLTHADQMPGTVEVLAASATDVPSPAAIEAQAQAELSLLMASAEREMEQRTNSRSEPGPNNNTVWYVSAGNHTFRIDDERANLDEYMPRDITVRSGDTVIWGSTGFHSVSFNPRPPNPPDNLVETLPDGTRVVIGNPLTRDPAKPSPIYDPTQWYNSGNLSSGQPNGTAWTLTFETPGTFEYYCSVHLERGMKGTVTVVAR